MRSLLIIAYMFLRHPILFWKYTAKKRSSGFLVNGSSRSIKTTHLVVGKNVRFGHDTRINFFGDNDQRLIIGNNCYFVNRNSFLVGGEISIGNNVLFASDIFVSSENHLIEPEIENSYEKLERIPVSVGDGCWIGEKAIILPGVIIGKKCVIGAGSVVTKSIPDYSIAVGNPARVIKSFDLSIHKWLSACEK